MSNCEVVVTGMGTVSAFGAGVETMWRNLRAGVSGVDWLTVYDTTDHPVRFGGEARGFDPAQHLKKHFPRERDRCSQLGLVASAEALGQAGLLDDEQNSTVPSVAAILGTGSGPCHELEHTYVSYQEKGRRGIRPTTVPRCMINGPSSTLSIYFGLRGQHHCISSACASGASAIGQGYLLIKSGVESIVLCGGSESMLGYTIMLGWNALRVLAQHEDPKKASRPFDRARNGLVMGEGAGMVVLESRESAERRGVPILAKVAGYGAVSDAHNITAPRLEGQVQAIRKALANAEVHPGDVDYVNAHGTSTQANDAVEAQALHEVFGSRGKGLPISSTKSMMGHSLGACAGQELIACVLAIRDRFVPPTINLEEPDPDLGLDLVPNQGREHPVNLAMSTSFAFGGNNSVILVQRFES